MRPCLRKEKEGKLHIAPLQKVQEGLALSGRAAFVSSPGPMTGQRLQVFWLLIKSYFTALTACALALTRGKKEAVQFSLNTGI